MSAGTGLPGSATARGRSLRSRGLWVWEAGDLSLTPRTGQVPTFARATVGGAVRDAKGLLRSPNHSAECWDMVDLDGDGIPETPGLVIDPQSTNLCLQSENFGTTWTLFGTPTRTAAALRCGALVLDLLGDDSAAALEAYLQTITFTGDAVKAISLFVVQGTSGSSLFALRDTTAAADRLRAALAWNTDGSPSVAMTTGTHLGSELWALLPNGKRVYRLLFQTTAVTAANTHRLECYPATVSGEVGPTGTLYVGGVQCENAEFPSGYVTTTTAAVTRNVDALKYPFLPLPGGPLTLYARFLERMPGDTAVTRRLLEVGVTDPRLILNKATSVSGSYQIQHRTTLGNVSSTAATGTAAIGDLVEVLGVLNGDGSVQATARRNGGTPVVGTASAALAQAAAWSNAEVHLGSENGGAPAGATFFAAKIAAGVRTLDQMAQLL